MAACPQALAKYPERFTFGAPLPFTALGFPLVKLLKLDVPKV